MADLGRDVHALGHAAVGHRRGGHRGHGRYVRKSVESQRRSEGQRERAVLGRRHRRSELLVRSDGVHAAGSRHVRQRRRGTTSTIPASISGTSRCSRTSTWAGRRPRSSARRSSTSSTTRTGTARRRIRRALRSVVSLGRPTTAGTFSSAFASCSEPRKVNDGHLSAWADNTRRAGHNPRPAFFLSARGSRRTPNAERRTPNPERSVLWLTLGTPLPPSG